MATPTVQQMLDHAREFTNIEDLTLDLWLQLENASLDDNARKVLDAGLQLEHFTSLLPNDPAERTPEMLIAQERLQFTLNDEVRLAQEALRTKVTQQANFRWVWDPVVNGWVRVF